MPKKYLRKWDCVLMGIRNVFQKKGYVMTVKKKMMMPLIN